MILPEWLKKKVPDESSLARVQALTGGLGLHTVCENARCPNMGECFERGMATFLILGNVCTRNCGFCAIESGKPVAPDPEEPERVARAVRGLDLRHVVITSVTRDDLEDYGAGQFADTIRAVGIISPETSVEVLVPDFMGSRPALLRVLAAGPRILAHNIETVPGLYPSVRPKGSYRRSLETLQRAKSAGPVPLTKSGLMLGLGERDEEVREVILDLKKMGCDMITLGQYLRPSAAHLEVKEYVPPERFDAYGEFARALGFRKVWSGPFVRSSYHAEDYERG